MAGFPRVSGDNKGVAVFDVPTFTNTGANAIVSGQTVQPQGPKLNFFTVNDANLEPVSSDTGTAVTYILQTVTQLSTIHMYEYTDAGANGTIALAIYPTAGQTAASLQTAIRALGTVSNVDLSAAVVANGATFTAVS
jgi:hypothetical protein